MNVTYFVTCHHKMDSFLVGTIPSLTQKGEGIFTGIFTGEAVHICVREGHIS